MTLVDKHALTAALAERDAARAEVARLRAAVEGLAEDWEFSQGDLGNDTFSIRAAAAMLRAALAATEDQP